MLDPDDAEAVRVDGRTLSYQALAERVAIHLARLDALGVGAGERVGVFTHASLDVVAALVASGNSALACSPAR